MGAVFPFSDKYSTSPVQNYKYALTWGYVQLYWLRYNFLYKITNPLFVAISRKSPSPVQNVQNFLNTTAT